VSQAYNFFNSYYGAGTFYPINNNQSLCTNVSKEKVVNEYSVIKDLASYGMSLDKMLIR
jgi:hypothetical protein